MDLPTAREIELETLLRRRDAQLTELTDEVTHLRQYLNRQPAPSMTDPINLPPPLLSVLLPHINDRSNQATSVSGSVTAALTHRVKVLQEENDELYELLKIGETGRLKEDVRALRRVVQKLEGALLESHQVISTLSAELEKSHEAVMAAHGRQGTSNPHSRSPVHRNVHPHQSSSTNGSGKLPPTGPRAHKKPRLSEAHASPLSSNASLPAPPLSSSNSTSLGSGRERRPSIDRKPVPGEMDIDEDQRDRARTPDRSRRDRDRDRAQDRQRDRDKGRDRDRGKDRERERERERERDRDRDKPSRRNGAYSGGGGRRSGRGPNAAHAGGSDLTLAERMGL